MTAREQFDCIIITQTLDCIYDVGAALRVLYRILKPGGVLLVTVPGISRRIPIKRHKYSNYWTFTSTSIGRLFDQVFQKSLVEVATYGNVFTAVCFLQGLAAQEIRPEELDFKDADYEVIISIRAVKEQDPVSGSSFDPE